MAVKPKEILLVEAKTNKVELIKAQAKSISEVEALKKQIPQRVTNGIVVYLPIKNEVEYAAADRRRSAAKGISKFATNLLKSGIDKVREALNDLLSSRKAVTDGANEVAEIETERMLAFRAEERRMLAAANEEANKERDRLQAIADAQTARANMLKSAPARAKALDKAAEAQVMAETVSVKASKVEAENSTERLYKKCRVTDKALLICYIAARLSSKNAKEQEDLTSILDVHEPELNAYFKLQDPAVGNWIPGVVVEEKINIFERGRK